MKTIILLFLFPLVSFSQKLEQVAAHNAYASPAIVAGPLPVLNNSANKLSLGFATQDSHAYIELSGSGWGASTINLGNEAIFLFSNDSTITVKSIEVQGFEADGETYKHRYSINLADVEMLSRYNLIGIRKYSFRDFSDIAIPRQKAGAIKNLSASFLGQLSKSAAIKTAGL